MAYTRVEWKALCLETGTWDTFVGRKAVLKMQGMTAAAAYKQAQEEITQSLNGPPIPVQSSQDGASPAPSDSVPVSTAMMAGEWQPPAQLLPAIARREDFTNFEAAADVVVRWVAGNMWLMDVKPSDAPCPEAWYLLWQCRTDPGSRTEFWRGTYPRLLTKTDAEREAWRDDNVPLRKLLDAADETVGPLGHDAEEAHPEPDADAGDGPGDAAFEHDVEEAPDELEAAQGDP